MSGERVSDPRSGTCAFSADVGEWYAGHEDRREAEDDPWEFDERFLEDGEWHCYRRTRPDERYCLFHAHESADGIESDATPSRVLYDIVNETTDDRRWNAETDGLWEVPRHPPELDEPFARDEYKHREKQFVGASLGEVEVTYEDLDGPDSYPIDLRLGTAETVDLSRSRVGHELYLDGFRQTATTDGEDEYGIDFYKTRIAGGLAITDATARGDVRLNQAEAALVRLNRTVIHGTVSADFLESQSVYFKDARVIDGDLSAPAATSSESLRCHRVDVDGDVTLNRVEADDHIFLTGASVGGDVSVEDVETGRTVWLDETSVGGEVSLNRSSVGNSLMLDEATVGELSVEYADIAGSVDLTDATVEAERDEADGTVEFKHAALSRKLKLIRATVDRGLTIEHTDCKRQVNGKNLTVGGTLSIQHSRFDELVWLREDDNRYGEIDVSSCEFDSLVISGEVDDGSVQLWGTDVEDGLGLKGLTVDGDVSIGYAEIRLGFEFAEANVHGDVSVKSTEISGGFDMIVDRVVVDGSVTFDACYVAGDHRFDRVRVDNGVSVTETEIDGELRFSSRTTIDGELDLGGTAVPELVVEPALSHPAVSVVSLKRSTVGWATLGATHSDDDTEPIYDLEDATVGDITLPDADPTEESNRFDGEASFERLRFLGTTFDGFVFSEQREQFRNTDWQAHRPRDGGYEDISVVTGSVVERRESDGDEDGADGPETVERGDVFEVAREVAEAAAGSAVVEAVDASTAGGADTGSGDTLIEVGEHDGSAAASYLAGDFISDEAAGRPGGDPLSPLVDLFNWTPTPQHDPSREWGSVAEARLKEMEEAVSDRLDVERTRRAAALSEPATERVSALVEELRRSIGDPAAGEGAAPTGSLPGQLDIDPDSPLSVDRLVDAVLRTLTLRPSFATEIAKAAGEERSESRAVDGGLPAPVATLCDAWEVTTGSDATPFEAAVARALSEGRDAIVEAATTMRDDHDRLVAAGLIAEEVSMDEHGSDEPHPYGAVADVVFDYDAVADAEFVADELSREQPRYRRVLDRLDVSLEGVEEAVARDLADYRSAMGTNNKLESTYALAKNGASEAGDETAAGNFFQREAGYARRQHWQRLGGAPSVAKLLVAVAVAIGALAYGLPDVMRLVSGASSGGLSLAVVSVPVAAVALAAVRRELGQFLKWAGNVFLLLTMGYGEKPTRVLGFAAVTVGCFALAYRELGAAVTPVMGSVDLGYLVFSLGAFVTLVLGTPPEGSQLLRLLAVLEGFIGVFVIGMFVVAVTRAIHR